MAPGFTPLADETVLVGFARTGIYLPIYHDDDGVNVYEHEIELVDSLREDEVIVLSCADNLRITPGASCCRPAPNTSRPPAHH